MCIRDRLGTGLAGNHLPRQHVAVVLHDGDHDLISGMDVVLRIAVSNQIDAFGGVAGKDDFGIAAGVQKLAYPLAGGLVTVSLLHAQFIQAAQGVGVGLLIKDVYKRQPYYKASRRQFLWQSKF